jgi:hypothetical protein
MVNPMEIMPILAMAVFIACIPILSDGPVREEEARKRTEPKRIRLPHPRR